MKSFAQTRAAPAKINLFLAITGVRADGFHNLVSIAAPIALSDTLTLSIPPPATLECAGTAAGDALECDAPGVPTDASNLVLRAAALFREHAPALPPARFTLKKEVPHGAGLGGGSSDGVATLQLLNAAVGELLGANAALPAETLRELAARLGSDCPLFLGGRPVIMRGRGEHVESLADAETAALRGRRLLLFKPPFGVATADAYRDMRAAGGAEYVSEADAEARIAAWRVAPATAPLPLFNNMEGVVFRKHLALPALLERLAVGHRLEPRMSGSGSACFAFLPDGYDAAGAAGAIRDAWGDGAFIRETTLL